MTPNGKHHRDRLAAFSRINMRDDLPVDELPWQVPEEVDYVHPREALDEFGNSRSHADKCGRGLKSVLKCGPQAFSETSQVF